ncbi:MAG: hypothetical protein M3R44_03395 [Candidatus Eremiobacteraeota bacterium]|nr:hypothetical protein [Candidatus Eremiobacteraeota bacterium]
MRRNLTPLLILVAVLCGVGAAYYYYRTTEGLRFNQAARVSQQRSEIRLYMTVGYDRGPLVREAYRMADLNGTSMLQYVVLGRNNVQITIVERPRETLQEGVNVAFLFDELVRDGIWDLGSKPPRGDTTAHYTLGIAQISGNTRGAHRVSFTDPHYWATTGGRQFHLKLDRNKPLPDLLRMSSTVLVEPRYGQLVSDFRTFGPPSFRDKIDAARKRLGAHT